MSDAAKGKEKNPLFTEFGKPLKDDWFQVVSQDLDGADFSKRLVWKTDEGFDVLPMYFAEDIKDLPHLGFLPGEAPFIRGTKALDDQSAPWKITQKVSSASPPEANREISDALARGQHGAVIQFDRAVVSALTGNDLHDGLAEEGVCVQTLDDFETLFRDINTAETQIDVRGGLSSLAILAMGCVSGKVPAHVDYDPLSHLLTSGKLPLGYEECIRYAADTLRYCETHKLDCTVLSASGDRFHNAGATAVQELAFTLATGVEYVDGLMKHGIPSGEAAGRIRFGFSVGTNFFMEIAKLRVARALWSKIMHHFGVSDEQSAAMRMHVRTSWRYQTTYDPWVNMLRGTVESMAAAIGGADSIYTAPFDESVTAPGEISRRIARNVQIILQEEAHIGQAVDPAAGSYYVEQLTASLAEHAWSLFREVEAQGGLLASIQKGFVQARIAESAEIKRKNISTRKEILIGTNQYPNPGENSLQQNSAQQELAVRVRSAVSGRKASDVEIRFSRDGNFFEAVMEAVRSGASLGDINQALISDDNAIRVKPIPQLRAAAAFERLRDAVSACERKPLVFLATLGPAFWRRARATFASGFFGTAGLTVLDHQGFATPGEAATAAVAAAADIVVLCSDDDSYASIAPLVIQQLRSAGCGAQVVVAGYPKDCIEQLRAEGVDEFIHVKADVEAVLASMLGKFGIDLN